MKKLNPLLLVLLPFVVFGQENSSGTIQGDFNFNAQTYTEDPSINASKVDEFMLMNGYSNILFNKGNFTASILKILLRFEDCFVWYTIPVRVMVSIGFPISSTNN